MSREKELVKNTAILTVGKMCTQFINFFLLPLYTTLLNPEEFGVVDLISTYISLLLPLVCWQFDQGVFRFMIENRSDNEKIKTIFSSTVVTNLLQCAVLVVLYIAFSGLIQSEYVIYLLIGVILNVFSSLLMQFARGLGKMAHYAVGSFITATGTVALNILLIVFLHWGAHGMFIATLSGVLLNCVYMLAATKAWNYFDFRHFRFNMVKKIAAYSLPLVPNQISGWVLNASDRTIITGVFGLAANGIFTIACKFSSVIQTFYGFFNMAWVETVSIYFNDQDRDQFINKMIDTVLCFFISGCIGIISLMPFVFEHLIDPEYADAYLHIPILLVAVIFQIIVGLLSSVYIALKKTKTIARTTVVGAVVNIIVHISLIRVIGLYAASVSTLVSFATVAIYRYFDLQKYIKIKFNTMNLVLSAVVFGCVIATYYYTSQVLHIGAFLLALFFAVYLNRAMIMQIFRILKEQIVSKKQ